MEHMKSANWGQFDKARFTYIQIKALVRERPLRVTRAKIAASIYVARIICNWKGLFQLKSFLHFTVQVIAIQDIAAPGQKIVRKQPSGLTYTLA